MAKILDPRKAPLVTFRGPKSLPNRCKPLAPFRKLPHRKSSIFRRQVIFRKQRLFPRGARDDLRTIDQTQIAFPNRFTSTSTSLKSPLNTPKIWTRSCHLRPLLFWRPSPGVSFLKNLRNLPLTQFLQKSRRSPNWPHLRSKSAIFDRFWRGQNLKIQPRPNDFLEIGLLAYF